MCYSARMLTYRPNPMIETCAASRHGDCCANNVCLSCGAHVSGYNATAEVIAARPEAAREDWWLACDNADCANAYGEGLFQFLPDWCESEERTSA